MTANADLRSGPSPLRRYAGTALAVCAGIALSGILFYTMRGWERDRIQADFERAAHDRVYALEREIQAHLLILQSLRSFYVGSQEVERAEFRDFAAPFLSRYPDIQALEWIPRVPDAQRAEYEAAARMAGFKDFQFTERQSQGRMVRAGRRAEHFPVYFVEPYEGNEIALGYDLASNPTRLEALNESRDTGRMVATARITLVQETASQFGVLVFMPVYRKGEPTDSVADRRKNLEGFVLGVVRVGELLEHALTYLRPQRVDMLLRDESSPPDQRFLWFHRSQPHGKGGEPSPVMQPESETGLRLVENLEVAGRKWSVLCAATPGFIADRKTWHAWAMLAGGLLFTGLLAAYLWGLMTRAVRDEQIAAKLLKANRELEGEIAERKQAKAELRQSEEKARQLQRLDSVGTLAGGIAHDFNNLLTGISGYAQLAQEQLSCDHPVVEDLTEIRRLVDGAATLIRQLLAFSRRQPIDPAVINLNHLVRNTTKMLRRIIGEDVELSLSLTDDLGSVRADIGQMEQVLVNLAINARDAMPTGGKLTVETTNVVLTQEYADQRAAVQPGPYVLLVVSDTGCGMDEQTRERIFEPFFTTKAPGKGTGLGLPMVYGIVKQHEGNIWVYSEPGRGTTVKIYLPQTTAPLQQHQSHPTGPPAQRGIETILLVEDEPAVRTLVQRVLSRQGYTILSAASPDEAEDLFARHSEQIDLLLTDVVMPGRNGRQLHDRLVREQPTLKVLYMSGYTDDAIVHHGVLDPGTFLIQKPFSPDSLAAKVRELLDAEPDNSTQPGVSRSGP